MASPLDTTASENAAAVTLSGALTDTGDGISLSGNAGSSIAFTGTLAISTAGGPAFHATGGGTVSATAADSTLTATGARALHLSGAAIASEGLRFAAVTASDASHGIDLAATGSGPLEVTGDGSDDRNGSGGSISGMSAHGILLDDTGPVTLRNMDITGNDGGGIRGDDVGGLVVVAGRILDNSDDPDDAERRNNVLLHEATGVIVFQDSLVQGSEHNQIEIENFEAGSATIDVVRTELRANGINSGLQVEARGEADFVLDVRDSVFAEHHATGVHAFARNTASLTASIESSTFEDNNIAVNVAAQHTATLHTSIIGNTAEGHASHTFNATVHDDAEHDTIITGNEIDAQDTAASVGVRLLVENDSVMRARVEENIVEGQSSGNGVRVLAREDAGNVHLVLRDNHVGSTSSSAAYSVEPIHESYLCAAIDGNTGGSGHPSRDLFVDLFDATASGDFEGLEPGPASQQEFEAHLQSANPDLRIGSFVAQPTNVTGVASGTCERPSE